MLLQISKLKMDFAAIVAALEAVVTGWQEEDDDSKTFFGDLIESGLP